MSWHPPHPQVDRSNPAAAPAARDAGWSCFFPGYLCDSALAHQPTPPPALGLDEIGELFGRGRAGLSALVRYLLPDFGIAQHTCNHLAEPLYDGLGRAGWRQDPRPNTQLVFRHADLAECGDVGEAS